MKVEQIREMSDEEIVQEIDSLQKELMKLRMGNKIGTVDNPLEIRTKRRAISRMKTILVEKRAQAAG